MTRQELLEARAKVEGQLSELNYGSVAGSGPSQKAALREQLREILAEIDQELSELMIPLPGNPNEAWVIRTGHK